MLRPPLLLSLLIPSLLASLFVLSACIDDTAAPATAVPLPTVVRPPLATTIPTATSVPLPSPSPSPSARVYTVRQGDSLTAIAMEMYGDANQWRAIFDANRDRLTSQDSLQVGQELRIPPLSNP